jgi:hypothetical protein
MIFSVFSNWVVQTICQQIGETIIKKGITNLTRLPNKSCSFLLKDNPFFMYKDSDFLGYISFVGKVKKEMHFTFGVCTLQELEETILHKTQLVFVRQCFSSNQDICHSFASECEKLQLFRSHPDFPFCFTITKILDLDFVKTMFEYFLEKQMMKEFQALEKKCEEQTEKLQWLQTILNKEFPVSLK